MSTPVSDALAINKEIVQEIEHGSWRGVIAGCYRLIAHAMVQRKHKI